MPAKEFCPQCGHEVKPDAHFCPSCGFDLAAAKAKMAAQASQGKGQTPPSTPAPKPAAAQTPPVPPTSTPAAAPLPKRQHQKGHGWVYALIALVVILGACYLGGSWYYSKNRQTAAITKTLLGSDPAQMAKVAAASDGTALSAKQFEPLIRLYSSDAGTKAQVRQQLQTNSSGQAFHLVENGRNLGLFPRYQAQLTARRMTVETNLASPTFKVDGQVVSAAKADSHYLLARELPGVYAVTITGTRSGESKTAKRTIQVPASGSVKLAIANFAAKKQAAPETIVIHGDDGDHDDHDDDQSDHSHHHDNDSSKTVVKTNKDYAHDITLKNDDHSTTGLVGDWVSGQQKFDFDDDGEYESETDTGVKAKGTYKVVYRDGDTFNVYFQQDGQSTGVIEPFALDHGKLIETNLKILWTPAD